MTLLEFESLLPAEGQSLEFEPATAEKNYGLNWRRGEIKGFVTGNSNIRQCAYKILATEQGAYPVYSESYGVKFDDLFGLDAAIVESEIKRRIKEALLRDKRIFAVEEFVFKRQNNCLYLSFVVNTAADKKLEMEWGLNDL